MAELTFKSAGVGLREIDLSGPTSVRPVGTPAGVIGTANRGPAFVPVLVANYQDFASKFGTTDGEKYGPLAMYEWLKNTQAGVYVRVLGAGDGKKRVSSGLNVGKVNNAGFVVGDEIVQDSGNFDPNPFAVGSYSGRVHFLGCYMSESAGSTYFSEAGIQTSPKAVPIVRGVLMTPSGVLATLSASSGDNFLPSTSAAASLVGFATGTMDISSGKQEFVLFLSGHISTDTHKNTISASFDPTSTNYFGRIFNTDMTKIEEAGHVLYTEYPVYSQYAIPTGSALTSIGSWTQPSSLQDIAFCLTSALTQNSGSTVVPNYEGFEDRFQTAFSPWVISQNFGGDHYNLFKVHALDDGAWANTKVKVSVRNLTPSTDPTSLFGTFDIFVRDFNDTDENPIVLETFVGLSINPNSERFVARAIGDMHTFYEFDREAGAQKLVMDGLYPNVSTYIRIEVSDDVINTEVPGDSLPFGFRGHYHLVTSGSSFLAAAGENADLIGAIQPPVPFRRKITLGQGSGIRTTPYFHWGVQFEVNDSTAEPNKNNYADMGPASLTKYFATYHTDFANPWVGDNTSTPDSNGTVYDSDRFNNNLFSLEQVQVYTNSFSLPDPNLWTSASYSRDGVLSSGFDRFLQTSDLKDSTTRAFAKFTFPLQGGFDGLNSFDSERSKLTNLAAKREMDYTADQGGPLGPTVAAYRKAADILGERDDVDIQLLVAPGMREPGVTNYLIDSVENRFDALYIMDIPEYNNSGVVITGSDTPSVTQTANNHSNRVLDTSFAAAYYPDVVMTDPSTQTNLVVPPSVAVLGAFALNDKIAYPWFAPAGFTRGALSSVVEAQVKLNRTNLDTLYSANINPITTIPGQPSPIVYGQKTLLARSSALDRVNVRRLLIEIRRRVRSVANTFLFEPNRESTLSRFSGLVNPILKQIQAQQGVERFRVIIDTSTTTQADVENNTVRGRIYVQPTKSIEFVSLDFVVSNAGASI